MELTEHNKIYDLNEEMFAGDLSNIYINPNEISINLHTNRMDNVIKPRQESKETIVEVVDNLKGSTIFNFTKELEKMETPDMSPLPDISPVPDPDVPDDN